MSTVDTSSWKADSDLNTAIEGIPLDADSSVAQTWKAIRSLMAAHKGDAPAVMTGASANSAGTSGLVPTPTAGDQNKVLKGDGTWGSVGAASSVAWSNVTGKPSSFTPSSHTHGNITNDGKVGTTSGLPLVTGIGGAVTAGSFGTSAGTVCEGNDSRLSNARTPTSHTHGNLTNDGKVGSTANLPLITTTGGAIAAGSFGTSANTFCQGNDSRLSDARTPTSHVHGNITNDGKVGTVSGKPLITGTGGTVTTGSFGNSSGTFCEGNDSRLSDSRTPNSHTHGNISNAGAIGSTSGLPVVTGQSGVLQAGSFGNSAGTFCEGNDSRLSDVRTPASHTHGNIANDGKLGSASRAVVTDGDKIIDVSSVTATELGYLSGVTSNVQTHLTDLDNEFLLVKGTADNCYAATTAQQLLIEDLQDDLQDLDDATVHKTGNEAIAGTKTFSSTISGSISGNAGTATKIQRAPDGTSYVARCTAGYALVNATHTGYGAIWNAKTKNYGVSMTTWPSNNDNVYIMAVTNANIASGTNTYARNISWNADNGTLTSTAFSGTLQTPSDEKLKTPLKAIPDSVLDAWGDVQWGQFQYLDAVDGKGEKARLHLGVIAQRVKKAFETKGLDACVYGILCYDRDNDAWAVRYAEAMAMETAYQRRRADRLELRLKAIEERLNV